jgi:hypothetical protein
LQFPVKNKNDETKLDEPSRGFSPEKKIENPFSSGLGSQVSQKGHYANTYNDFTYNSFPYNDNTYNI